MSEHLDDYAAARAAAPVRQSQAGEPGTAVDPRRIEAIGRLDPAGRAAVAGELHAEVGNAAVQRLVQREEAAPEEPEEEEGAPVQAKADQVVGLAGGPVPADVEQGIDTARSGGSALDSRVQAKMEGSFGTSFADVRVHAGSDTDGLNQQLGAKAFTTGSDVFVRSDQYSPGTPAGDELLAHELTHVVQQRSMTGGGPMTVGPADDHHEHAADAAASAAIAQRDVEDDATGAPAEDNTVARQADDMEEEPEEV